MTSPYVLVACEYSGRVRDALRRYGINALSCDLLPTEREGPHYQGPVEDILYTGFDAMIAFPDCTYLCGSGIHWNDRGRGHEKTEAALGFVDMLLNCGIPQIALENPVGVISTRIRPYDQLIQPYEFEEDASKRTCLWLDGFPVLEKDPAKRVAGRMVEWPVGSGRMVERWSNQTDSGQNRLAPSETRGKDRALTYQGIADAMAEQWSPFL